MDRMMKSAMLTGVRKIEVREIPIPAIVSHSDVLVKMETVGICGSDVHYYLNGGIGSVRVEYPFTLGHEGAGRVAAVGSVVRNLQVGDQVVVEPAMSCGKCDQCLAGRPNTCRSIRFMSSPGQASGLFSEYVKVPVGNCFRVKEEVSSEQVAFAEPLSIAVYTIKQSGMSDGDCIGILGSGPIGLGVQLVAKRAGARKIYVTDKVDARLQVAGRVGADWTGNPDTADIVSDIVEREPLKLDIVFECCGKQEALTQAVDLLKPGGTLVIVGIPSEKQVSFQIENIRRKEITIYNIRRQNDCMQAALDLIEKRDFIVDPLITHRFPLDEASKGFEVVADYADGVVKAMIMM